MCRGKMKIIWWRRNEERFVFTTGQNPSHVRPRFWIPFLRAQRASFGWLAAIQRSTESKKSVASPTISSASVWVATEAWS